MLRRTRSCAAAALALAVLAGCGSDKEKGEEKESAAPSPSATSEPPYLEVPSGVTLTEPGTALDLGEEGVIAFERRQDEVGVLAVTVQRIERTSFQESFVGWNVDDVTAARTPYFVRLTVTNVGEVDLAGMQLVNILWADDGETLEAPNYYTAQQLPACNGGPLPTPFAKGASAELCQVYYIAPAHAFESVSFPPFGGLDEVTWSGELSPVTKPGKAKPSDKASGKPSGSPSGTPSGKPSGTPSRTATPGASGSPSAS